MHKLLVASGLALLLTGCSASSTDSKISVAELKADVGAQMACGQWRLNVSSDSAASIEDRISAAEVVKNYANASQIPEIVSISNTMFEALKVGDSKTYKDASKNFDKTCKSLNE